MTDDKPTTLHIPDVDDDTMALINALIAQLEARRTRNHLRACYYDGKNAVRRFGSGVIPESYFQLGLVLGWTGKAVDVMARRCNLDGYTWPDGDLEKLGYTEVWDDNFFGTESSSAVISSLIHGPAFLINTDGDAGEPTSLIHVEDAMNATGEWNPRTRHLDNLITILARDDDRTPTEFNLYLDGRTLIAAKDGGTWEIDWKEHSWGVPVEAVVYKPRVGRPFGYSRISRVVMSLQDRGVRAVLRMEGHADIFSYPELWMLGANPAEVFTDERGNSLPTWKAAIGRLKGVKDDLKAPPGLERAEIQQFQQASPTPHIDLFKQCANDFAGQTDLPVSALGVQAAVNTTTADGSDNAEKQLIAEAEGATDDWSPAFRRAMMRALAIKNGESTIPPQWRTMKTKWRNPAYASRSAMADAGMKQLAAVPWLAETEVGLELLGLTAAQAERALAEKRRARATSLIEQLAKPEVVPTSAGTTDAPENSGALAN